MQAAIISLGLIGAGTNNARIAGLLRKLSSQEHGDYLYCVSTNLQQRINKLYPCFKR